MKSRSIIITSLLMCLIFSAKLVLADEVTVRTPITIDNADQITMTQMLGRGGIYDMAWSPNGRKFALVGPNGTWLYDARDWTMEPVLLGGVLQYAWEGVFDTTGRFLVTAGEGGWSLWDTATNQRRFTISLPEEFNSLSAMTISPDGRYLVTAVQHRQHSGSEPGAIAVWELETGAAVSVVYVDIDMEGIRIDMLEFSSDGKTLLVTMDYGLPALYKFEDLLSQADTKPTILKDYDGELADMSYAPDGELYALYQSVGDPTLGRTHEFRNISQDKDLISVYKPDWYAITTVDYNFTSNILAASGHMGDIELYNITTGSLITTLKGQTKTSALAFDPSGQYLISYNDGRTLKVWDIRTYTAQIITDLHTQFGYTVRFHPNSQLLAFGTEINEGEIHIWDVGTEHVIDAIPGAGGWTNSLSFSPDALLAYSAGRGCCPQIWDVATDQLLASLKGHDGNRYGWAGIEFVSFVGDGSRLLSGGQDGTARLWDVRSGEQLQVFTHVRSDMEIIAGGLVSEGQQVLTLDKSIHGLWLWDVATGQALESPFEYQSGLLIFSRDGKRFAIGSHEGVVVYESDTLKRLYVITPSNPPSSMAFSPDNTMFAMIAGQGNLSIYDLRTGKLLAEQHIVDWYLSDIDWSTDGTRIALTGREGVVFVFGMPSDQ